MVKQYTYNNLCERSDIGSPGTSAILVMQALFAAQPYQYPVRSNSSRVSIADRFLTTSGRVLEPTFPASGATLGTGPHLANSSSSVFCVLLFSFSATWRIVMTYTSCSFSLRLLEGDSRCPCVLCSVGLFARGLGASCHMSVGGRFGGRGGGEGSGEG